MIYGSLIYTQPLTNTYCRPGPNLSNRSHVLGRMHLMITCMQNTDRLQLSILQHQAMLTRLQILDREKFIDLKALLKKRHKKGIAFSTTLHISCPRNHIIHTLLPFISNHIANYIIFICAVSSAIGLQEIVECPAVI